MRGKLILIDGLPGAGKSTAAEELSAQLIGEGRLVRVWMETDPLNPLHVFKLDPMGAATAALPVWMAPDEFADASLEKWQALIDDIEPNGVTIVESYPFQSAVRVLLQHDVPVDAVRRYWSSLLDSLAAVDCGLVYFHEPDPRSSLLKTCRDRGPEWTDYVLNAIKDSPMFQRPGFAPIEAAAMGLAEYGRLTDELATDWPYAKVVLPATTDRYDERRQRIAEFAAQLLSS